jgi:hypothetical protein
MSTLFDELIYFSFRCAVHFHDHQNKMMPLMKLSIFADLSKVLSFASTLIDQLITFEITISSIGSIIITSKAKT